MSNKAVFIREFEGNQNLCRSLYRSYKQSKELCNERINFVNAPRDEDEIKTAAETLKGAGVKEFTISDRASDLIKTLAGFADFGYEVSGIVEVLTNNLSRPECAILLRAM